MPSDVDKNSHQIVQLAACPLCRSARLRMRFEVQHVADDPQHTCAIELGFRGATISACDDCDFEFKLQQPSSEYLREYYAKASQDYLASLAEEHGESREDFRQARQILFREFPQGGKILDVGCASGFFLESLGNKWERFGVELFHVAAERARQRPGLTVGECDLTSAAFADHSFDAVCSFDVLEHVYDASLMLREARRIVRPGGLLVLGTGDCGSLTARLSGSRWTYRCFPEHISFFNQSSLRAGLRAAGFTQFQFVRIHHGTRNRAVATGWLRAVGKHWAVELLGKRVVRFRIFRQKTIHFLVPYFFDHMICIAR
jgi:SAM-dependent methyltransferase